MSTINEINEIKLSENIYDVPNFRPGNTYVVDITTHKITTYYTKYQSKVKQDLEVIPVKGDFARIFFKRIYKFIREAEYCTETCDDTSHKTTIVYDNYHKEILEGEVVKGDSQFLTSMIHSFVRDCKNATFFKYDTLEFKTLLLMKKSYDFIDAYGKKRFSDWSMEEFEKKVIGADERYVFGDVNELRALYQALSELNTGDETVYASSIFMTPPESWRSRGGPFFWAYVSRHFSDTPLGALDKKTFKKEYMKIVKDFGIPFGKEEDVYIERFDGGGMSRGMVSGLFVKEALDELLERF